MTGDREANIWHYLHYKVSHGQRFVMRAAQNRRLEEAPGKLFELPEVLAIAGSHMLNVMQKGGRAARQARMFRSWREEYSSPKTAFSYAENAVG